MMTSIYGKRRNISLEYRIALVNTGEVFILYPGQLADFCRVHKLHYNRLFTIRRKKPMESIPMYKANYSKTGNLKNKFVMLPSITSMIRP